MLMTDEEIRIENMTIGWLERHMKHEPGQSVVIFEDMDLLFSREEMDQIKGKWNEGINIQEIAETFFRDQDEIFLALFHMARNQRKNANDKIVINYSQLVGGQ